MAKISSARQYKAILRKDIVMEMRTGEMLTSMGLYAVLVLIVYGVALSQAGSTFDVQRIAAGLLWLAILFTSMLGLNRSLVHEKDQGCLMRFSCRRSTGRSSSSPRRPVTSSSSPSSR